jgi:hypothetical protein
MSDASGRAIGFASADHSEELARAELYGLLARRLRRRRCVAAVCGGRTGAEPGELEAPWQSLVAALRATSVPPPTSTTCCSAVWASPRSPTVIPSIAFNERLLAALRGSGASGLRRGRSRGQDHT